MAATTDQKARLLDLATGVLELVRDDKRSIMGVSAVMQVIKDDPNFVQRLLGNGDVAAMPTWPVWRGLEIGCVASKQLLDDLKRDGCQVSEWARNIIGKPAFTTLRTLTTIELVRIKVRDLGFTEEPTTTELFARAKKCGLDLCLAEVGPHLRLVDKDQPRGTWYWIAMKPITDSDGSLIVFYVRRGGDGGRWLLTNIAHPKYHWLLDYAIVFVLRK